MTCKRLFYCLVSLLFAVRLAHATGPQTTSVSDVVYRADSTPAAGTLVISWPAFASADNFAVAAGSMSLTIGPGGAVTVALVPNAGATPAGAYYKVVYQLDDGSTSTEFWSVPSTSPTTIAAIRSVVVPATVAAQFVSKSYVDSAVAGKAADTAVVHLSGSESVSGAKTFTVAPSVPTPVNSTDAANKSYVDSVAGAGGGGATGSCSASQYVYALNGAAAPSCRGVGAVRFADQFANIQAAITDAGASGSVVIPASYAGADSYTNPDNINIQDLRGAPDRYKTFVNVVSDCGAKGDGLTDDGPAIQNCLNSNPGRHIIFPKMCVAVSGGGQSCIDYKSSVSLSMLGNGQWLDGEVGSLWQGAPVIAFTADVSGILDPVNQNGVRISNLEIMGAANVGAGTSGLGHACWTYNAGTSDWNPNGVSDGIYLAGLAPILENVIVEDFSGNGINLDGSAGLVNNWRMTSVASSSNCGHDFFIHGANANTGHAEKIQAADALGFGIKDTSLLGNVYDAPQIQTSHEDHNDPAGSAVNISSVSRAGNIVTVTTVTSHGFSAGAWITLAGVTDASFNHTFRIASVPSGATFTFNQVAANSSSSGGAVKTEATTVVLTPGVAASPYRTAKNCSITSGSTTLICNDGNFDDVAQQSGIAISVAGAGTSGGVLSTTIAGSPDSYRNGQEVTLAAPASATVSNAWATYGGGFDGGAMKINTVTGSVFSGLEMESAEGLAKATSPTQILGSNNCNFFDYSYGSPVELCGIGGQNSQLVQTDLFFRNTTDNPDARMSVESGRTSNQLQGFIFGKFDNSALYWDLVTTAGAAPNLQIRDLADAGQHYIFQGIFGASPETGISSVSSGKVVLNGGGTGGTHFQNGSNADVAVIDSSGKATLNGGLVLPASTAHGVLIGEAASSVASTAAGTSGQCLLSGGASADPAWGACGSTAASPSTPNGSLQASNASSTAFAGLPIIDLKAFGCAVDGATDDTTCVNNAIAALSNGGTIHIPYTGNLVKVTAAVAVPTLISIQCEPGAGFKEATASTDLFTVNANSVRIGYPSRCILDGGGNATTGHAILVGNVTAPSDLMVTATLQNWGTNATAHDGHIHDHGGTSHKYLNMRVLASSDRMFYFENDKADMIDLELAGGYFEFNSSSTQGVFAWNNSGTNLFKALHWHHNFCLQTGGSCFKFNNNTGTMISFAEVDDNTIVLNGTSTGGFTFDALLTSSIHDNHFYDNGKTFSNDALEIGDCYRSSAHGNSLDLGGQASGINVIDVRNCDVFGNSLYNVPVAPAGGGQPYGIQVQTSVADAKWSSITGNILEFASGTNTLTPVGIKINGAVSSHVLDSLNVSGNTIIGNGAGGSGMNGIDFEIATGAGITAVTSNGDLVTNNIISNVTNGILLNVGGSGTQSGVAMNAMGIYGNNISSVTTGINAPAPLNAAGFADLDVGPNIITGATTPVVCTAGSNPSCITHTVNGTFTLSSGSAVITLAGHNAFTSASSYNCDADDTTGANLARIGTYTSGTQFTINGATTDTGRYSCRGY